MKEDANINLPAHSTPAFTQRSWQPAATSVTANAIPIPIPMMTVVPEINFKVVTLLIHSKEGPSQDWMVLHSN